MRPRGLLLLAVVLAVFFMGTTAAIAAPANDTSSGAVAISTLPSSTTLDTRTATTDAEDAEMNPIDCGAPATDASVWYGLTLAADTEVIVDVSQSSYSAGVLVSTGPAGSRSFVTCGPQFISFTALANETYYLLVIDDQLDGEGNGGDLTMTIDVAPPAPTIDITVNPTGTVYSKDGTAVIGGTATCTGDAQFSWVEGQLKQFVGRVAITGWFYTELFCDGTPRPWTATVYPDNGRFGGGKAQLGVTAVTCGFFACGDDSNFGTVNLKGKGKK